MKLIRFLCLSAVLVLLLLQVPFARAQQEASDLTLDVTATGYRYPELLTDGDIDTYGMSGYSGATITLRSQEEMGSLYLMFDLEYGSYTVTDPETGTSFTAGQYGMLHEYVDLVKGFGKATKAVILTFSSGAVSLSEIRAYAPGKVPNDVQIWEPPLEGKTDLMLMSTHGDDEQLFFAGLLPYYAGELKYNVQVVYMTDHRNFNNLRTHEMLNGLWAVGVRNYPVFGPFYDFLRQDMASTYAYYEILGIRRERMLSFVTEQIRRFDPMVIVGHDFAGEYGHGMHMVYTDLLVEALELTNDPAKFPDSAKQYGLWDVPKTYIHLYEENPIVLDYDKPLEAFDGLTAFEATRQLGFPCHKTQQGTWFTKWIEYDYLAQDILQPGVILDPVALGLTYITEASQFENFSPCRFGLYRSTVGPDVLKNDFLEHIITHDGRLGPEEELIRQEQERLETERLEQERREQERLDQERLEKERLEAERKEQERLEAERREQERLEKERMEAELLRRRKTTWAITAGMMAVFAVVLGLVLKKFLRRQKKS